MRKFLGRSIATAVLAVLTLAGCYDFESGDPNGGGGGTTELSEVAVEHFTFSFMPDSGMGAGVAKWWFDFDTPPEIVYACNVNMKFYTSESWSVDKVEQTIDLLYNNGQEEHYKITSHTADFSSGDFYYSNSIGSTPFTGTWHRLAMNVRCCDTPGTLKCQ